MAFKTGNSQLDYLMSRARRKNATKNALKQEEIDVDNISEREESEGNEESRSLDIGGVSSSSGIGVEPVGVSKSIEKAQEDINIASAMPGVGSQQTAGQVAFGLEQAAGQKSFMETNPVGAALTGYYDSALAQGIVNTAPAVAAYAGNIEAARALGTVSNVLGSPVTGLVSGIIGPSMQDPYGQTVAMGSGLLGKVSSSLMSTHYGVADEVAKGTPGYGQGYFGGSLVSVEPGIFGGLVYSGVNVPDVHVMSPTAFMEAIKDAEQAEDEAAVTGELGVNEISLQNTYGFNDNAMSDIAQNGGSKDIGFNSKGQAYSINANNSFTHSNGVTTNVTDRQGDPINAPDTSGTPSGKGSISTTNTQTSGLGSISTDDNNDSDGGTSSGTGDADGSVGDGYGGGDAYGGRIGNRKKMAMGDVAQNPTTDMGFIGGPPDQFTEQQTIADDIPKTVPKGAFIINAPAVEFAGKEDIKQMLVEAYEIIAQADTDAGIDRTAQAAKIPSKEQVDIMISRGEVVVPPEIAKVIGYDRLEKINNRGKKEVARRQEESQQQEKPQARQAAEGGSVGMANGGISSGFIDYNALERNYGTTDIDQIIQKKVAGMFGVREQGEKAQEIAYNFAKENEFIDNDKSEDTLRHILGGGFMADEKLGFAMYNLKENPYVNMIYGGFKGQGFTLPTGKAKQEAEIDLNNNEFGRALRQKYPDEKEFIRQAKKYLMGIRAGEEIKPVNGFRPMMSLGTIQREN